MLVVSRSRSVTPLEGSGSYDRTDYSSYNYINMSSGRPPKILESPLDSKSLLSGKTVEIYSILVSILEWKYNI